MYGIKYMTVNTFCFFSHKMSFSSDASAAATAAESAAAAKKLNIEKATNFMKQYRDPHSRELKKLSANQFMDVWSHYDKDGEYTQQRGYKDNNVLYFISRVVHFGNGNRM